MIAFASKLIMIYTGMPVCHRFAARKTTKKSPGNEIAKTIILTCDVARSFPSRVHVTFTLTDVVTQMSGCLLTTSAEKGSSSISRKGVGNQ